MTLKPIIWTISGADCSGGAGIAADIKTGHGLGVEVCHLMTANTVQNSQQLLSVNPVDIDILAQQAQALMADKPPKVIKVGLLANEVQVHWLINLVILLKRDIPTLQVVFDPVGQASVGGKLSFVSHETLLPLFHYIDVLTPNLLEAQLLTAQHSADKEILAKKLTDLGVKKVVIKGGHSTENQCVDYCYDALENIAYQVNSARVNTKYSHGGGCSFATAITSFLAYGYLLRDAFTLAKAFINEGLSKNAGKQDKYGAFEQGKWPNDKSNFPIVEAEVNQKYHQLTAFEPLGISRDGSQSLGLYPVVDSVEWLKRLMPLGIHIIQLRLKGKTEQVLRTQICEAVTLSKQYDCRLFINDYWSLAIEYGAYGVHIGQEDLFTANLAAIQKSGLRLGISTHGCYEFLLAQQLRPSYLAIGAIFPTKTKNMTGQIQGVDNLAQILKLSTDIPVVAIGGINHQRAASV